MGSLGRCFRTANSIYNEDDLIYTSNIMTSKYHELQNMVRGTHKYIRYYDFVE